MTTPTHTSRRRGSVYIAVLGAGMIVIVIGLSALWVARIRGRTTAANQDAISADLCAQSALDLALFRIGADPNWRTTYTHDTWTAEESLGDYTFQFKLVDEADGDLANDPSQPARLYAKAGFGAAVRLYSVLLEVHNPPNLLRNADMEDGTEKWTGDGLWGDCDLQADATEPHSGSTCILARNRVNQYGGPNVDITEKITKGTTYYTEVWIKGTAVTNGKYVCIDMDTSDGLRYVSFYASWSGTEWHKVTGTLTPTWTGTLKKAYWHVETAGGTVDFKIDDALFVKGADPPGTKMLLVSGTWRRETLP